MLSRVLACLLLFASPVPADGPDTNWPRFRGPDGSGVSNDKQVPTKWSAETVTWSVKLPVAGHSSPILWGDKILLTGTTGAEGAVKRHVICLDRNTQKVLWNKSVAEGRGEKLHQMNSWATPSCVTDGENVVAFFGDGGLHCFNMEGSKKWSRDLGSFPGAWGVGASPIILGDLVLQNCDAMGDSYLLAVNKDTGKTIWKTPRRATPRGGWSTPVLIQTKERQELILNGEFGVQSYDPKTGKDLWYCKSFNGRGTPTPAWGHGMLFVVNGKPGDLYAVKPGGSGDVTASHMAWHSRRNGGRDLPSPVLVGNRLFAISMGGVVTCYEATTGEELWVDRLSGKYSASPVVANGLVYATAEDGTITVLEPADEFMVVSKNTIDSPANESFRSSAAISKGQLFFRSDTHLFCVGK